MGMLSSIAATIGIQPVARAPTIQVGPVLATAPATMVESQVLAVMPVQVKTAGGAIAPELSQTTAARLLVQNAQGIELDNIPFFNDDAVLLDDLPMPEKPALPLPEVALPEPEADPKPKATQDLVQVAARGYLASREAAAPPAPAETETKATPPEPAALLGSGD